MGLAVERETYSEQEIERFGERLGQNLDALAVVLQRPRFGVGPPSIGAELEASIVGEDGLVRPVGSAVVPGCADPRVQYELLSFNVELNLTPQPTCGRPLHALEAELTEGLAVLEESCAREGAHVLPIGIVPTLRPSDLRPESVTDRPRYRALINGVERLQARPLHLDIRGERDALVMESETIAVEGSNTSFQVHLRVDPERYADTYNAAQLATSIVLGIGANSPILFENVLWDETRVPLFKQAFAGRNLPIHEWRPPVRVPFGHGWVRQGVCELFREAVSLFPPVLAEVADEDPVAVAQAGGVPSLDELRLHVGTTWQWNRPVYDPTDGGHVRVEMRALPSGPTPADMTASAALLLGLTVALRDRVDELLPALPFRYAEHNFYRAAQRGLNATLLWPSRRAPSPEEVPLTALVDAFLPRAAEGLVELGVDADEARHYLGIIEARRSAKLTGARWLSASLRALERFEPRPKALQRLTMAYLERAQSGQPVHTWDRL